ncbi:NADH-quinone oxidoreductase subunit NuoE [Desulfogranum japonicum]|uniref:NADH-quinone oxidoreductase subunit NuoE n=1 Tax=Desulfogranum japonicum TaxID=231447 RepID=UPI000411A6CC|nr:NADH-quinone oxidoreductase subunit NuoE [Desulfogranum japonicum]
MSEILPMSLLPSLLAAYDRERENLIPLLQKMQESFHCLSPETVKAVADHLHLSENDVYGVATFYSQIRFIPPGRHHIRVCDGTACHVRGSDRILEAVEKSTGVQPGQTSEDGSFSVERVACFGSCALAPVMVVDDKVFGRMTGTATRKLIEGKE